MTELDAVLILNAVSKLSNIRIKKLISYYGSAVKIFSLSQRELESSGVFTPGIIENILKFPKDQFLKDEYQLIASHKVNLITFQDHNYPHLLNEIYDSPNILYVKGKIPENINMSVSIVGSRKSSLDGLLVSEKFASQFAELGITVVSGMARGIDTAAHHGVLKSRGKTVAVLGSGLTCIYPSENKKLYEDIAQTSAVISEFSMKTSPVAYNFPRRNRIISGLSLGVIVIEAALRSGALITADFALEQGREVFAVPGKINQQTSCGVNNLIKQGAQMITCIEDVLEELRPKLYQGMKDQKQKELGSAIKSVEKPQCETVLLEEKEQSIYDFIKKRPVHIDELVRKCGLGYSLISTVLIQLEIKRIIKQLPGKLFVRT